MPELWYAWVALGMALVLAVARRREHAASIKLAMEQRAALGQLAEEVTWLREALLSSGTVERTANPPEAPAPAPVLHFPSADQAGAPDEPPSTKPARSRTVPGPPRSGPRPVPFEDQVQRAMRRIERQAKVPPLVAARWEQRLRALGAELGLPTDAEPTDSQLGRVIRELYEAEADVKDGRPAAAPPLESTLASAVSPIAVMLAEAAPKSGDAEGGTTHRRGDDRPAALPRPNADDNSEDGRDTGEDMTKVFSKSPGEADAQTPGVEVKRLPPTVRPPPHQPPRPIVDLLAGVQLERPTSSATRAAEAFRARTTLHGGITAARPDEQNKGGEP